jgi:hypothetical protein
VIPTFRRVVERQHHIYHHSDIDNILECLSAPNLEHEAIAKISRDRVPDGTLRDWHCHRVGDENWFPLAEGHPRARALNSESEAAIADFVCDNYIHPGIGATQTHLKYLCFDSYAAQNDDERHLGRFCEWPTFLHDLERRQGLCLRMPHKERRAPLDEEYAAYLLNPLNNFSNDYPPDLVFNLDETCWRLFDTRQNCGLRRRQRS